MARITKFTVYVDKAVMDNPDRLYDAVLNHMFKKETEAQKNGKTICDFDVRKKFRAGFFKAHETEQVAYIDTWVSIRDAETFPLRFNKKKDTSLRGTNPKSETYVEVDTVDDAEEKADGK